MTPSDVVGAVGVALLLVAFALNSRGVLHGRSRVYHGINAVGSAMACAASWMIDYVPFVVLEGSWCVVATLSLVMPHHDGPLPHPPRPPEQPHRG